MILQKITVTRPDKSIPWHWVAMNRESYLNHLQHEYIAKGKLLANYAEHTSNGLSVVWFCYWDSKQSYEQSLADAIFQIYWDARSQYINEHGVQLTEEIIEIN